MPCHHFNGACVFFVFDRTCRVLGNRSTEGNESGRKPIISLIVSCPRPLNPDSHCLKIAENCLFKTAE